jgi:hypothetical protein
MKKDEMIRASYNFLKEKAQNQESITVAELQNATGWTYLNTRTNISKRIKQFLTKNKKIDSFCVNAKILDVEYSDYAGLFKQADYLVHNYDEYNHPDLLVYELFMPLTCEDKLKKALEKLFYKDTVKQKIKIIGIRQLKEIFHPKDSETNDEYIERICQLAGNKFGGYSISHVSGRFRAFDIMSKTEAAKISEEIDSEYLIDETTAIVKFIFPIQATEILVENQKNGLPLQIQMDFPEIVKTVNDSVEDEIKQIEWLFRNLFISTILNTVGQEQIWVLQSGKRSQLTRFVAVGRE